VDHFCGAGGGPLAPFELNPCECRAARGPPSKLISSSQHEPDANTIGKLCIGEFGKVRGRPRNMTNEEDANERYYAVRSGRHRSHQLLNPCVTVDNLTEGPRQHNERKGFLLEHN
jgi:hypothetical protein